MDPALARLLADALLALHAGIVVFNLVMPPAILLGGCRGWAWVRRRDLRLLHLLAIGGVAVQAALGELCFLTHWESALRQQAGGVGYDAGFVDVWLGRLIYVDAPVAALAAAYLAWAALSAALWWRVPPAARLRS